jgi:hypothetical protein
MNQISLEVQLGVTLTVSHGWYGNGAPLKDIARTAGCPDRAVEKYTARCFQAIESLHDAFVCLPTIEATYYDPIKYLLIYESQALSIHILT